MQKHNDNLRFLFTVLLGTGLIMAGNPANAETDTEDTSRHERLLERFDRNDNGALGPRERQRARHVRDRLDRNDDGKVGPRERQRARNIHNRLDRNDDGRVGKRERKIARKIRANRE